MTLNELKKQFNIPLEAEFPLDVDRLPYQIEATLDALVKIMPEVPRESLLLDLLIKIAQLCSLRRVKLSMKNGQEIPANLYAIIFMPSGEGKDRPLHEINNSMFKDVFAKFKEMREWYIKKREKENYDYAVVNFTNKAQQNKYIAENRPRILPFEMADGTMEGLLQVREEFEQAGFGGTFFKISEFADFILSNNERRNEMLSLFKEIYDYGDSQVKVIKGDRTSREVKGVPCNVLFHSSISGLQTDEGRDRLMSYLNRGLARRGLVCYPDQKDLEIAPEAYEDWISNQMVSAQAGYQILNNEAKEYADSVLEELNSNIPFTMDAQAVIAIEKYKWFNRAVKMPPNLHEALAAERKGRNWKAMKLATILAAWEHPEFRVVTEEDVLNAIYLTEYYGQHFEKLIKNPVVQDVELVFARFVERLGDWLTTMDIRTWGFTPKNRFANWFNEVMLDLEILAMQKGYELQIQKIGKIGKRFRLVGVVPTSLDNLKISISKDITSGYTSGLTSFEELHKIANSNVNYSSQTFKDGYRKKDNYIPGSNLIILDFDDGWSLEQTLAFLKDKDLKAVLTTTKSHQKPKNGKICDRFRLFLPAASEITLDAENFSEMMQRVMKFFNNVPDKACKDASRFYYGNPKGQVFYSDGSQLFDWRSLPDESESPPKLVSKKNYVLKNGFGDTLQQHLGSDEMLRRIGFYEDAKEGNRNNFIAKALLWLKDEGSCSYGEIQNEIIRINQLMQPPLPKHELEIMFKAHLR